MIYFGNIILYFHNLFHIYKASIFKWFTRRSALSNLFFRNWSIKGVARCAVSWTIEIERNANTRSKRTGVVSCEKVDVIKVPQSRKFSSIVCSWRHTCSLSQLSHNLYHVYEIPHLHLFVNHIGFTFPYCIVFTLAISFIQAGFCFSEQICLVHFQYETDQKRYFDTNSVMRGLEGGGGWYLVT